MRWLLLAAVVVFAACGGSGSDGPTPTPEATATATATPSPTPEPTCSTEDGELVFDALNSTWDEFYDEITLADSTPRMQLAPRIAELQRIRREVEDQEWPDCGVMAQSFLVSAMEETINGFIAFLAQKADSVIEGHFDRSGNHFKFFTSELEKIRP